MDIHKYITHLRPSGPKTWILHLFTLIVIPTLLVSSQEPVTVRTNKGEVKGLRYTITPRKGQATTLVRFLGIPFAEPPVGKLRFKRPKPHPGWSGTLDATQPPPVCPGMTAPPRGNSQSGWGNPPSGGGNPQRGMGMPPSDGERPPPGLNMPPSNGERPPPSLNMPPSNGERPPPGLNMPPSNGERPPPGLNMPPSNGERPPPGLNMPSSDSERPPPGLDMPPSNGERPPPGLDMPPVDGERPPPGLDMPPSNGERPPPGLNMPPSDGERPPPGLNMPPPVLIMPSHGSEMPPPGLHLLPEDHGPPPQGMEVTPPSMESESEVKRVTDSPHQMPSGKPGTPPTQRSYVENKTTASPKMEGLSSKLPSRRRRAAEEGMVNSTKKITEAPFMDDEDSSGEIPFVRVTLPPKTNDTDETLSFDNMPPVSSNQLEDNATSSEYDHVTIPEPEVDDNMNPSTSAMPVMATSSAQVRAERTTVSTQSAKPSSSTSFGKSSSITSQSQTVFRSTTENPLYNWDLHNYTAPPSEMTPIPLSKTTVRGSNSNRFPRIPPPVARPERVVSMEDCLFLNIFAPENPDSTTSLPVMIFIHGGGFRQGSALDTDPSNLAVQANVIVVTIAYRLHAFGFLSLPGSQDYPGNLALWDQVAAMRWVRESIATFGGDPRRVTLSGHSAGAMSVSMHVASPTSKGLFQSAHSMSGVLFNFNGRRTSTQLSSQNLLQRLNCNITDPEACLATASQEDIASMSFDLNFTPINGDQFFPEEPMELIKTGKFNNVPYLLGLNSDEGILFGSMVLRAAGPEPDSPALKQAIMRTMDQKLKYLFGSQDIDDGIMEKINSLVEEKYLWDTDNVFRRLRQSLDLLSDLDFVIPVKSAADEIAKHSSEVYLYYFNHSLSTVEARYEEALGIEFGAGHIEPLPLFFGLSDSEMSRDDQLLSADFIGRLSSFLHGRPSFQGAGSTAQPWPAYDREEGNYVYFGEDDSRRTSSLRSGFMNKSMSFWSDVIPAFVDDVSSVSGDCGPDVEPEPPSMDDVMTVVTSHGKLKGNVVFDSVTGRLSASFLGIPYAAPPVGRLRWQPPAPLTRWQHVRLAQSFAATCPQRAPGDHSEDCLHLNVWVPHFNEDAKFPVLVYINTTHFLTGSGNSPVFGTLAVSMQSVVVSINFRLGALGFLSTGSDDYPGNYAHRDILMALRWVQDNIFNFRGYPSKVTLVGVDAGAALTSQLTFLRQSRGLFSRVISLGGTGHAPWAADARPMKTAQSLAQKMGCQTNHTSAMMECLLGKDAEDLVQVEQLGFPGLHGFTSPLASYPWRPAVSEDLNWLDPLQKPVGSFLSGATTAEGFQMSNQVSGRPSGAYGDPEDFLEFLEAFMLEELQAPKSVYLAVKTQYFPADVLVDSGKLQEAAIQLWTDWAYLGPLAATMENFEFPSIGFAYLFDYDSQSALVSHGDDYRFFIPDMYSDDQADMFVADMILRSILQQTVKGFVDTGFPISPRNQDIYWAQYSRDSKEYLYVTRDAEVRSQTLDDVTAARMRFWTETLPKVTSLIESSCNGVSDRGPGSLVRSENRSEVTDNKQTTGNIDPVEVQGSRNNQQISPTSESGMLPLNLQESQIVVVALGGVCALLLLVVIALACNTCTLKRRLVDEKRTTPSGVVLFDNEPKHATKM